LPAPPRAAGRAGTKSEKSSWAQKILLGCGAKGIFLRPRCQMENFCQKEIGIQKID